MNMLASHRKSLLESAETIVIKVGSRVLSSAAGQLDLERIRSLAFQLAKLVDSGRQVVLVSSGAVASGLGKLGIAQRPTDLARLQAVASVGQAHLIQTYEKFFSTHGRHAAQILLTAEDFDDRQRYLNVRNTLLELLDMGVIPIINENDAVAVDELQTTFGDNDQLAAMVSGLFARPALIILSDVDGVYDRHPDLTDAKCLTLVEAADDSVFTFASTAPGPKQTGLSKGGMGSKLKAAKFVVRSGSPVIIAGGRVENILLRLVEGEELGTLFLPEARGLAPKKRWIGFTAQSAGILHVDDGAAGAIRSAGKSLLAIGVVRTEGKFEKGDVISVCDPSGNEIARGLTNYNALELDKIKGLRSHSIATVLGYCPYDEVVHRNNLTLVDHLLRPK